MTVDHLNHNKRDNSLKNLEWVTKEENWKRAKEDYCQNFDEEKSFLDIEKKEYIKLNNVIMSIDDACDFLTFPKKGNCANISSETIKNYIHNFIKRNTQGKKEKYGYVFERL